MLLHCTAIRYDKLSANRIRELVLTATRAFLRVGHPPLFRASIGEILAQEYIEGCIDVLEHIVTNEEDAIKALHNHANLFRREPAVIAVFRCQLCRKSPE